ncbi:FAD-dependent oxidoreductase [Reichenbachiella versicolor]|uniref:FAD-dependent oxidoreductase n=1 Tax=Reichenbachiella versicolor TaxID=1821036 RepID=UPI000D6E3030|nr:FAD-dependent oxidoreductase [Reichenbachiella versicolor]
MNPVISVEDRNFPIQVFGTNNSQPIVYFNLVPDIPEAGLTLCQSLSTKHQVFYVEDLSCSQSVENNTYEHLTFLAKQILLSLKLNKPLLIGHLSGGHIAAEVARLHPELAGGVYLIHTPIDVLTAGNDELIKQTQLYWDLTRSFITDAPKEQKVTGLKSFWKNESWWPSKKEEYLSHLEDDTFLKKATNYLRANFEISESLIRPKAKINEQKIAVPTMLVYDHKRIPAQLIDHDFLSSYASHLRVYPFSLKSLKPWLSDEKDLSIEKSIVAFFKDITVESELQSANERRAKITEESDSSGNRPMSICIIGAGAAGLSCALALKEAGHDVTIIEKQSDSGISPGHSSSVTLPGGESVDPAFGAIIPALYPNTINILDRLEVDYETLSYANKSALYYTQDRKLVWDGEASYPFSRKVFLESEKLRNILQIAEKNHGDYLSLEDVLNESDHEFSMNFWHHYFFGRMIFFFGGHKLRYYLQYPLSILNLTANLDLSNHKICRITNGSGNYMRQFKSYVEKKGVKIINNATGNLISKRTINNPYVKVSINETSGSYEQKFDHLVFGILPDEALKVIGDEANDKIRSTLSSFSISDDTVILHKDASIMPPDPSMWRYMNVMVPEADAKGYDHSCVATKLFYSNHDHQTPTFVTHAYGQEMPIKDGIASTQRHVHINVNTVRARKMVQSLQGEDGLWYCGSWLQGLNFHEDAIVTGLNVANSIAPHHPKEILSYNKTKDIVEEESSDRTFVNILKNQATFYRDKKAFLFLDDKGNEIHHQTYEQLLSEAENLGYYLRQDLQLKKGDTVVLCYLNAADHYIAFLGCTLSGIIPAIVTPMNPKKVKSEIDVFTSVIDSCGGKAILTDSKYYSYYLAGRAASPSTYGKKTNVPWYKTDKIKTEKPSSFEFEKINKEDISYLQYTSGSMGIPKGIVVTHEQLLAQLEMLEDRLKATPPDKVVSWAPHFHNIGLVGIFLQNIFIGSTTVSISPLTFLKDPKIYMQALSYYQAAFTVMPNFGLKYILDKIKTPDPKWDLSRMKTLAMGGERVDPNTMEKFVNTYSDAGFEARMMAPGYGLGEHVTIVSLGGKRLYYADKIALMHQQKVRPGTHPLAGCGVPVKGVDVRIVDPTSHKEVATDRVGEIWVSSPSKASGYIHLKELSKETFEATIAGEDDKTYLRTGDLGFIHEGEVFVCDRLKNMINVRGVNCYPTDIEETLDTIEGIFGSIAFSSFSDEGEEQMTVVAEVINGSAKKLELKELTIQIQDMILMNIGVTPERIVLIKQGQLPRTSLGKLQRRDFEKKWNNDKIKILYDDVSNDDQELTHLVGVDELDHLNISSTEAIIVKKIKEVARVSVDPQISLFDQITLDSIEVVLLVEELSTVFQIDLSLTILEMCDTVEDIANYIQSTPEYKPLPSNILAFNIEKKKEGETPIFMMHPARGGVHCYLEFARELDLMFYGVSDNSSYSSVEDKAREYCQLIRQVQPTGPYILGGYSFGGTLSLAMASILENEGELVEQVILIDEGHATKLGFSDAFDETVEVGQALDLIASDYVSKQEIQSLKDLQNQEHLSLKEVCNQIADTRVREQVLFETEAYLSNIGLLRKWEPDFQYSGPISLLKTTQLVNYLEERYQNVIPIPGDHFSIIRQPYIKEVSSIVFDLLQIKSLVLEEKQ